MKHQRFITRDDSKIPEINNKQGGLPKINAGTLSGTNPYVITGIPNKVDLIIIDSLDAVCKNDTLIAGPNCNCTPKLPQLINNSFTVCAGDTFPTLQATVFGLATVEWFSQATGGTAVATGLTYKPSGNVPVTGDTLYAQARSTDPSCLAAISTQRVPAYIIAQNCAVEIDLALKKMISKKVAQLGDTLTYTIKVWNESNNPATGVEVRDTIATSVSYVANTLITNRTSASISANVITWTIGNMAANGDTVTLTYKVKAISEGIHFNTAQITRTNEKDKDSTPNNNKEGEDDIDRQCFTVPVKLCPTQKVEVRIPSLFTGVRWFKDTQEITTLAGQNIVLLEDTGTYTYTAINSTCPVSGCCPVIIQPDSNCCIEDLCIPFTIKKREKKK